MKLPLRWLIADWRGKRQGLYTLICACLLAYIALCAWKWDNRWLVDSWEHHRAVKAIAMQPWQPGNPTVASDEPSIRYSPITVALGLVSRWFRIDPANSYSASAIVCALWLFTGLWKWLAVMGAQRSAWATALMMVCVWAAGDAGVSLPRALVGGGGAPGWANSLALADLPGNMAYPAAWAFAASLWGWWIVERMNAHGAQHPGHQTSRHPSGSSGHAPSGVVLGAGGAALALLTAFATLTHIMTAVVMVIGLLMSAVLCATHNDRPMRNRLRGLLMLGIALVSAGALSLLWPWYSLWKALISSPDAAWFDREFLRQTLLIVTMPALLGALLSCWWVRDLRIAKWSALCGGACWLMGIAAWFTESPALARVPVAGAFFWHVMMGVTVSRAVDGRRVETEQRKPAGQPSNRSTLHGMCAALCLGIAAWGVLPQLKAIAFKPYLMRPWLAPLLGRENQQMDLRARFARLIGRDAAWGGIGIHDVVMSDIDTSWPIPSIRGRIVSPAHLEYFVTDQAERSADVRLFFSDEAAGPERRAILLKYGIKWIMVHRQRVSPDVWGQLVREQSIVARDEDIVVMRVEE